MFLTSFPSLLSPSHLPPRYLLPAVADCCAFLSVRSRVPGVQLGRRRWEGWSKKTLSSPLHTGLRDETSAAADGCSSSERRARCSSRQAKRETCSKYLVVVFFCLCFEKKNVPHPLSPTRIPALLIRGNVMNDECAGESDDPPPAVVVGASTPRGATRGVGVAAIFRLGSIIRV